MLRHLAGTRGAVQPDADDRQLLECRQGGGDLRAEQQRAVRLDRDLHEDGHALVAVPDAQLALHVDRGGDGDLTLQQILRRLDEQRVGALARAAIQQAAHLLRVAGVHRVPVDLPQRDELGARPHRPDHKARLLRRRVTRTRPPRDLDGRAVDLSAAILQAELDEHVAHAAERVGLHDVAPNGEEALVDRLDHVGPGEDENLAAVLQTVVVGERQVGRVE
jgi:hypothetical protein